MSMKMFSEAGKTYDRSRTVRPLSKEKREKMYAAEEVQNYSKVGEKKFSPFRTIGRTSRDSYLLKVTKQPNTHTNYDPNFNITFALNRRSTIDQAPFQRIIGPVNDRDYSIKLSLQAEKKYIKSLKYPNSRPLTVRETHKWRRTLEHLDFRKQPKTNRENPEDFLKTMKSTRDSFLIKTLQQTTESNFNNFRRFSLKAKRGKAHDFSSDSGHEYLKAIETREIQPQYSVENCKEEFTRQSMRSPKGELRFSLYRNQIKTRVDRSDPYWLQTLDYTPEQFSTLREHPTIDITQLADRKPNEVHSKYPIRQSLEPPAPLNN